MSILYHYHKKIIWKINKKGIVILENKLNFYQKNLIY